MGNHYSKSLVSRIQAVGLAALLADPSVKQILSPNSQIADRIQFLQDCATHLEELDTRSKAGLQVLATSILQDHGPGPQEGCSHGFRPLHLCGSAVTNGGHADASEIPAFAPPATPASRSCTATVPSVNTSDEIRRTNKYGQVSSMSSCDGIIPLDEPVAQSAQSSPGQPIEGSSMSEPYSFGHLKEADILMQAEIAKDFEQWKLDPLSFLSPPSIEAPTSMLEFYRYATVVAASSISGKILWRFTTTALYDATPVFSRSDKELLIAAICESHSDRDLVEKNITQWRREGKRNRKFADELGSTGCFFFYPQSVADHL